MIDIESLKMPTFFKFAWAKRSDKCQCGCGKYLGNFSTTKLDHLLEKAIYPECKYSISNIFFVRSECHQKKTNGFPSQKHKERINWAKDNYEILVKESKDWEQRFKKLIK